MPKRRPPSASRASARRSHPAQSIAQHRSADFAASQRARQRHQTRQAILTSAFAEFLDRSYAQATVDSVAARAGTSRATFYRYFENKSAVAQAIFDDALPKFMEAWNALAKLEAPTEQDLVAWCERYLAMLADGKPLMRLFREVQAFEGDISAEYWGPHRRVLAALRNVRGFRRASQPGDIGMRARVRAYLFFVALSEFGFLIAVSGWSEAQSFAARTLAEHLHRIMASEDEDGNPARG